jgi:peptidase E
LSEPKQQIIAIGGAGFSAEYNNLPRYVIEHARRILPSVCFIPTASGDSPAYIEQFYATFSRRECRPCHLTFFDRTPDLRELLLSQDVIYVGGGNTKSMLAIWREWNLPDILREAWQTGVVLTGSSAGAICWFETCLTDSWADRYSALPCLGFLEGGCCPHYDGEKERRPALRDLVAAGSMPPTIALEDGVAAHFVGRSLLRIVSAHNGSRAYRVYSEDGVVVEKPMPTVALDHHSAVA